MLLQLNNITIGYEKPLASNFSAEVKDGELVLLVGRNGVGKSTLLSALKNTLPPLAGEVALQGVLIQSYSVQELSRRISIVNTSRPVLNSWSVYDLLENTVKASSVGEKGSATRALELCKITDLSAKLCDQLSDGEFQKVMIARAIAQQTPLIIMDEPTSFLDVIYREQVLQIFKELKSTFGTTVVLSSHNFAPLLSEASQVWVLNKGDIKVLKENLKEQRVIELMT